jgi:uncharacterized protein
MRKQEIIKLYEVAEEAVFPDGERLLLICINRTIEIEDEAYSLYDKVRYSWKVSPTRAEQANYVLAVAHGLIIGVFEADEWLPATKENFGGEIPGRYGNWENQNGRSGFRGREASDGVKKRYLHKRVPDELRGHGGPIRYLGV